MQAREGATLDMSVATTVKADTTPASAIATDAQSNPEGTADVLPCSRWI